MAIHKCTYSGKTIDMAPSSHSTPTAKQFQIPPRRFFNLVDILLLSKTTFSIASLKFYQVIIGASRPSSKKEKTILNSFSIAILINLSCYFPSNTTTCIYQNNRTKICKCATCLGNKRSRNRNHQSLRDSPNNLTRI